MDLENNNKALETTDDQTNQPKAPSSSNNWKFIAMAIFLFVASLAGILYYNRNSLSEVVIPQKTLSEEASADLLGRGCLPEDTDQIIGAIFSDSPKLSFKDDFRHLDMESLSKDDVIYCYRFIASNEKNDDFIDYSLKFAIHYNLLTLAKVMIYSGNYKDPMVYLIRWIVESPNCSVEMFKLLLDAIDDIVFIYFVDTFYLACEKGKFEIATLLLEKRPEYLEDICSAWNYTPIQRACQQGNFEIFQFLLENGANADVLNSGDSNILHLAVYGGDIAICRKLLELKPEFINSVNLNSQTPLHIACETRDQVNPSEDIVDTKLQEKSDIIKLLLGKGASKDAIDLRGNRPISYLDQTSDAELIEFFKK